MEKDEMHFDTLSLHDIVSYLIKFKA